MFNINTPPLKVRSIWSRFYYFQNLKIFRALRAHGYIFNKISKSHARKKKVLFLTKSQKFLVRKGSIFSKNQLVKSIIFWTFLDRFPPNNGQKPLKFFARFARMILGSQKNFGALRAHGSIFNKISKFRALRARGSIFNKISKIFARFAREVLLFPKSSRKSDPYGNSEGG